MSAPTTRREDRVEDLHGRAVADPYRWLEDADSDETAAWVAAQNDASRAQLDALPAHAWFRDTLRALVMRPRAGTPSRIGERYLLSRNDGSLAQDQWFVADSLEQLRDGGRLLVDPNTFSADGTSSLAGWTATEDGSLLAYLVSDGGSDWNTIRVLDVATGAELSDVVTKTKFSTATWLPDGRSFLYLHFPTEGAATGRETAKQPPRRLVRHRLGTPQDADEVVLDFPDDPDLFLDPEVSDDGRWLVVHIGRGTSEKNRLWVYPLSGDGETAIGEPVRLFDEPDAGHLFVRSDGSELYVVTDLDAPRGRVVRVDLADTEAGLEEVVPEREGTLEAVVAAGEELVTVHLEDVTPVIRRWGLDGSERGTVDVAGGAVLALRGKPGRDELLVGVSSVTARLTSYVVDLGSGAVTRLALVDEPEALPVVTERRRATSADGTQVPYFLVRRADIALDRPRPTLLYGYGGFHSAVLADYRAFYAGWLAAGGVLAIANLRGGNEFGQDWHDGGRLHHKQNVFDDFVAIGEQLVADRVTTHEQLALHGRSNGGLLVGAVMTQRPDLAAVALPMVGVLDMLRYHLFTVGAAWAEDYGSPDDPEFVDTLLAYSPLHNVREGTAYPATLVLTGDHDDRVVPAHSFKFTAALQHAQGGDAPILARIETATGHGAGKPAAALADETADLLAFAAAYTGLTPSR